MIVAAGFPIPHGPIGSQILLVVGVLLFAAGVFAARRPYRTGRPRGGFGAATGRVVEHREGKRPTVVEFVPDGRTDPVQFKTGDLIAIGTSLPVLYSLADPRNARPDRPDSSDHTIRGLKVRAGVVLGLVAVVLAVLWA